MSDHVELKINGLLVYDSGVPVTPPVDPPPVPTDPPPSTGTCSGPNDLSSTAMKVYQFAEGQYQDFCFRTPSGGWVDLTGVAQANTTAKKAWYSVNGGAEQSFAPSGSDFRFKPIEGWVSPGVQTVRIKITGILGEGKFGLQATGAVGP